MFIKAVTKLAVLRLQGWRGLTPVAATLLGGPFAPTAAPTTAEPDREVNPVLPGQNDPGPAPFQPGKPRKGRKLRFKLGDALIITHGPGEASIVNEEYNSQRLPLHTASVKTFRQPAASLR